MHEEYQSRFLARVRKTESCWIWMGGRWGQNYGCFAPKFRVNFVASRFAWEVANNQGVPDGMQVCHSCDNPPCVRPDHLWLGKHLENAQDRDRKGRLIIPRLKGEDHGRAILTEVDVRQIRSLYAGGGHTHKSLAESYGVSAATIRFAIIGKNWPHVV